VGRHRWALRQAVQPPVSTIVSIPTPTCAVFSSPNILSLTKTVPNRSFSKYGWRSESIAETGGAFARDSTIKRITDIEVLQQAEASLQKASGGFSFFGNKQDKCIIPRIL